MTKSDFIGTILSGLPFLKKTITDEKKDKLYDFFLLFCKYNDEYDLSRIKNEKDIVVKHFIDSLFPLSLIDIPSPVLDLGTGAGFPGIPLKIMSPQIEIILAEPKKKRVEFMQIVIRELGLDGVSVFPHLVGDKVFFKTNGIICRAFMSIDDTLELVDHFMPYEGKAVFLKGPNVEEDLINMSEKNKKNYFLIKDIPYDLGSEETSRRLLVLEKKNETIKKRYKIMNYDRNETTNISSIENAKFKSLKKIVKSGGLKKTGMTLVTGVKIIKDVFSNKRELCCDIFVPDDYVSMDESFNKIFEDLSANNRAFILKKSLFNEIDILESSAPVMTVNVPEIPEWNPEKTDFLKNDISIFIPFQDPSNTGSVIRSAAAFGVSKVIILKEGCNPFHPKSVRSSGGAVFSTRFFKGPSIVDLSDLINDKKINVVSLDKSGTNLNKFTFPDSFFLLPGIEGAGLPEILRNNSLSIEMTDKVESLNAAVTVSIVLHKLYSEKRDKE